jgi:hypothetical protein
MYSDGLAFLLCCQNSQHLIHVSHVAGRFVFPPNTTAPVVGGLILGGRPMIAFNIERNETTWQQSFVAMLPEIEQKLRLAFCRLDPEAREDAMEEGVVHSLLAYVRLVEQGRAEVATPSSLAWYSSRHVRRGRPAGGRMNGKEPLSRYGQISNNIEVERQSGNWINLMVQDKRAPVVDQVAAKMDVGAWFATLTKRMKEIAKDLAFGCSTSEVAEKHGVSAGRISQLRRVLEESWTAFQQEAVAAMA